VAPKNILLRHSRKSFLRNTFYNCVGQGLPLLVAVVTVPLLVKGMGTERFGTLSLAWIFIGYFGLFDIGLGRALTRFVAERLGNDLEDQVPHLARSALLLIVALAIIGSIIAFLLTPWIIRSVLNIPESLRAETTNAFYLLSLSLPFVLSTTALRGILEAFQRFGTTNTLRVAMGLFTYLGPLIVLPFTNNLAFIFGALVVGRIFAWIAHLICCLRIISIFRISPCHLSPTMGSLLRFGGWMTISNLIAPLIVSLDRFLIGAIASVDAVAYYATPYQVVSQLAIIPSAFVGVLFPAVAASNSRDPLEVATLFRRTVRYITLTIFPISLILVTLAHEIIQLWLGQQFAQHSSSVLQLLVIGMMFNGLALVPLALLQAVGHPDITAKLHTIELPFYTLLLWFMTKHYGITGAALACIFRMILDSLILYGLVGRFISDIAQAVRRFALVTMILLLVLIAAALLESLTSKVIYLSSALTTYMIIAWQYGLTADEHQDLRRLFLRC
jgi:O-antigen/teichoic acid export membrane protein